MIHKGTAAHLDKFSIISTCVLDSRTRLQQKQPTCCECVSVQAVHPPNAQCFKTKKLQQLQSWTEFGCNKARHAPVRGTQIVVNTVWVRRIQCTYKIVQGMVLQSALLISFRKHVTNQGVNTVYKSIIVYLYVMQSGTAVSTRNKFSTTLTTDRVASRLHRGNGGIEICKLKSTGGLALCLLSQRHLLPAK